MKPRSEAQGMDPFSVADARLHEEAVIKAFIVKPKHRRMISLLANPKRRGTVLSKMYHFRDLDSRWAHRFEPRLQNPASIGELLRSKGAPAVCYAVSTNSEIDGRFTDLNNALMAIVGYGHGTLLSCIPGKLGYFEDEEKRFILERT
jgi:hypothetical protein